MVVVIHQRIDFLVEDVIDCAEIAGDVGIVIRIAHRCAAVHDEPGMMTDLGAVAVPGAPFAHLFAYRHVFLHRFHEVTLHAALDGEDPDVADGATFFLVCVGERIDRKQQSHEADETAGQFLVPHFVPPLIAGLFCPRPMQGLFCAACNSIGHSTGLVRFMRRTSFVDAVSPDLVARVYLGRTAVARSRLTVSGRVQPK